jgi:hypothetical protein
MRVDTTSEIPNELKLFSEREEVYWTLVFVASQKGACG